MRRAAGWAWKALIVAACVAYPYLVHVSVTSAQGGLVRSVLLWFPLAALGAWVVARARNKATWLATLFAGGVIVFIAENQEWLGLASVSGISHATAYLFLLGCFGRTLAPGTEPMVTRFARRVHGALPPDMERFTRSLTIAWCVFFAAQLIASALLFAFASLEIWSAFVNLLNLPLLGLMFAGQWGYRRRSRHSRRMLRSQRAPRCVSIGPWLLHHWFADSALARHSRTATARASALNGFCRTRRASPRRFPTDATSSTSAPIATISPSVSRRPCCDGK
jgi:uncharacterized membrane protein